MSNTSLSYRIYSPNYRRGLSVLQVFNLILHDFKKYKTLLWRYFKRDFVASYQQSMLGILWKVILPMIPISVYIVLQAIGVLAGSTEMPRSLFVVAGMTFWQLFASVLTTTMNRLDNEANMLKKVRVPLIVIFFSGLGQLLFDFFVRLGVLVFLLFYFNIEPNFYWLALPFMFVPFVSLGLGLGILLSFFAVYIKDVKNIVTIFVTYGMFASSVLFPIPKTGIFSDILYWNGIRHLIDSSRNLLVFGSNDMWAPVVLTSVFAFFVLIYSLVKLYSVERQLVGAL